MKKSKTATLGIVGVALGVVLVASPAQAMTFKEFWTGKKSTKTKTVKRKVVKTRTVKRPVKTRRAMPRKAVMARPAVRKPKPHPLGEPLGKIPTFINANTWNTIDKSAIVREEKRLDRDLYKEKKVVKRKVLRKKAPVRFKPKAVHKPMVRKAVPAKRVMQKKVIKRRAPARAMKVNTVRKPGAKRTGFFSKFRKSYHDARKKRMQAAEARKQQRALEQLLKKKSVKK